MATDRTPARVYRLFRFAVFAITAIALAYIASRYSFTEIPTDGLDPELMKGERVLVDEWGGAADRLEPGQFVIYDASLDEKRTSLAGEVAAAPGGTYPGEASDRSRPPVPGLPPDGRVPEGHAVILNGENSRSDLPDSRIFGPIDVRAIRGRILARLPF